MANRRRGRDWRTLRAFILATRPAICHLCGGPIDLTLPASDPMAPEVDHLEPVTTAPHRQLDAANLAPSHKRCNRERGAKAMPPRVSRHW